MQGANAGIFHFLGILSEASFSGCRSGPLSSVPPLKGQL